jgi:uncharacterized membrane protein
MNKNYIVLFTQQVVAVSFLACLWTCPANAQLGDDFIRIDPPKSVYTYATSINNDRKIVGVYYDAAGTGHGFLRNEDGRFITINHPKAAKVKGGGFTEANGINSAGVIAGDYCAAPPCDGVHDVKGYLLRGDGDKDDFDKDDFTPLEIPGHNEYVAHLNSERDVVGCYHDNDLSKSMHGFLWDDGKVTTVPVPAPSMNTGINDESAIVGFHDNLNTNTTHSYLLRKGVRTPLNFPGAVRTVAQDINNYGRVVGFYVKKDNSVHGFLWHKGKFTSVDIPGAVRTFVAGINSVGDIVGEYDDATTGHGFLLHWRDYEDKDSDDDAGN